MSQALAQTMLDALTKRGVKVYRRGEVIVTDPAGREQVFSACHADALALLEELPQGELTPDQRLERGEGFVLIKSRLLDETFALCADSVYPLGDRTPEGHIVYSVSEMKHILREKMDKETIQFLHYVKNVFGGQIECETN